jgi:Outer membrane efflux protein
LSAQCSPDWAAKRLSGCPRLRVVLYTWRGGDLGARKPRGSAVQNLGELYELWSCAGICSWLRCRAALVSAFLIITASGCPAVAETLQQALTDAYLINSVLNSERARLRATDEQVALAKAGLRPFISGSGDVGFMHTRTVTQRVPPTTIEVPQAMGSPAQIVLPGSGGVTNASTNPRGVSVQLTQPLFEGLQNLNAIRGALNPRTTRRSFVDHQCRRADCRRHVRVTDLKQGRDRHRLDMQFTADWA